MFDGCLVLRPGDDLEKATLQLPATPGVNLFTTAEDKPVMLLSGANLRSMIRRRMAEDDETDGPSKKTALRPIVRRIWFRRTYSPFETHLAYFNIARSVYPETYEELFPRLASWFLQIDPAADYPFFQKTSVYHAEGGIYWGPLPDGRTASRWGETVQNIFDLCRCPEVLSQAPEARPCSYAEMGRCDAVCDGSVSISRYRHTLDKVISFLDRPLETIADWETEMQSLSAELKFEEAQAVKQKIAAADQMWAQGQWAARLNEFGAMAFQPGPNVKMKGLRALQKTVTPFVIGPGWVRQIESFLLTEAAEGCRAALDHAMLLRLYDEMGSTEFQGRLFAWAAHLLYYNQNRDPGLYVRFADGITGDTLEAKVRKHFEKDTPSRSDAVEKPYLDAYSLSDEAEK